MYQQVETVLNKVTSSQVPLFLVKLLVWYKKFTIVKKVYSTDSYRIIVIITVTTHKS